MIGRYLVRADLLRYCDVLDHLVQADRTES